MSTSITFPQPDGATYIIPAVDDENWGQNVSNFLIAIPNGVPPRNGTFALTGDLSFGPSFGLQSQYYKSLSSNIASAGFLRLAKTDSIGWRNNANSANLPLAINGLDQLTFNGAVIGTPGAVLSITGTAHQIIASSSTGNITLSAPQNIDTTSSPTFATVTASLTGNVTGNLTGNVTGTASGNLPLTGGTLSGALDLGSNQIHHVANGTAATDAVNFSQISGFTGFQSGDLKAAAYSSTPSGWLLCDGTSYPTAMYPTLFAAIGYAYGGAGANFNVPNLINSVPVGVGGSIAPSLGSTAGTTTHAISVAELPTGIPVSVTDPGHTHILNFVNTNPATGSFNGITDDNYAHANDRQLTFASNGDVSRSATTGITATANGSGTAMSLVQPSIGVNWFIKI